MIMIIIIKIIINLQDLVYKKEFSTKEQLKVVIQQKAKVIQEQPEILRRATQNIIVRAKACIKENGKHFEHLLK